MGDSKVRPSHAELEGKIRSSSDDPAPGEEPGCRCWAGRKNKNHVDLVHFYERKFKGLQKMLVKMC